MIYNYVMFFIMKASENGSLDVNAAITSPAKKFSN